MSAFVYDLMWDEISEQKELEKQNAPEEVTEKKEADKEEAHVTPEHAAKMTAKWEKIQKKEAKKAEKSKMPQKVIFPINFPFFDRNTC